MSEEESKDFESVMKVIFTNGTREIDVGVWSENKVECKELFDHIIEKIGGLEWFKK